MARRCGEAERDMLYDGPRRDGSMAAGQASGRIVPDETGTLRIYLKWQWLTGDRSAGESEWVQI